MCSKNASQSRLCNCQWLDNHIEGLEGRRTSFPSSNFDLTEHKVGDFARAVMWKGSSRKKIAVGRDTKKISSKKRVKSNTRQKGSTLGPKILSLCKHIDDAIVTLVRSTYCPQWLKVVKEARIPE